MNESFVGVVSQVSGFYSGIIQTLPTWLQNFINLFLLSLLIVVYSVFIWKFYRWISKKDILELNLSRFNKSEHEFVAKVFGAFIYFVEYLVILPFVVFLWFGIFVIFLMLLTKALSVQTILVVCVVIVAAIRMTAYYKEDLSRDLAKLIPFNLLALAIAQGLFDFPKIIDQILVLPSFFSEIWIYLIFIVVLEFILRFLDIIFEALGLSSEREVKEAD